MAMYLDVSYELMIKLVPFVCENISRVRGGGMCKDEMLHIIRVISGKPPILIENHYDPDGTRAAELKEFIKGRKALLSARSLNFPGVGHCVYWDGEKLFDPSRKKTYTIETIEPYEIII